MRSDGLEPVSLTGRWVGFYRYRSEAMGFCPITAEIEQENGRITGEMYDQVTDRTHLLETLVEANREHLPLWRVKQMENVIRHFGAETVSVSTQLPAVSTLDGSVNGTRIEFTKTYLGTHRVAWAVEGEEKGSQEIDEHRVDYSGTLDLEGGCITGGWQIRRRGFLGRFLPPLARGTFELYRKP